MEALSINTFISAVHDVEKTQFQILSGLKKAESNFHRNRIYPDLAQLIELYGTLQNIAHSADTLEALVPKRLKDFDTNHKTWLYEPSELKASDFEIIRDLMLWALPHIQRTIEEGKTMFEFVDENLSVEVVGILPTYLEEGYVFVPDNATSSLYLIKYEVSIFTQANERYRSLKTTVLESVRRSIVLQPAETMKLQLIKQHPELPNPATYAFSTDLEFPFHETVLPVAKRRLLRCLYS
jgi:cytochrome c-type biogenesis protein CcmE